MTGPDPKSLALSDGNLDENEHGVLCAVGQKWGLSEAQANEVLANPDKVRFVLPNNLEERFHQLYELVVMMLSDGQITGDEMDLCVALAARMGFRPSAVKALVEKIVQGVQAPERREESAGGYRRISGGLSLIRDLRSGVRLTRKLGTKSLRRRRSEQAPPAIRASSRLHSTRS